MLCSYTITQKKITEPNFIIFELFSVISALWLPNRIVSGINWFRGVVCAQDCRIPYRITLGIIFGNFGGRITKPKLFWS